MRAQTPSFFSTHFGAKYPFSTGKCPFRVEKRRFRGVLSRFRRVQNVATLVFFLVQTTDGIKNTVIGGFREKNNVGRKKKNDESRNSRNG